MYLDSLEFKLYEFGRHNATVTFIDEGVIIEKRDLFTDTWLEPDKITEENYEKNNNALDNEFDFFNLRRYYDEFKKADWDNNNGIEFSRGHRYQRAKKNTGKVVGEKTEAYIWAQRDVQYPMDIITVGNEVVGFILVKRMGIEILVKSGYENITPLKKWQAPQLSQVKYSIEDTGSCQVQMRDGTYLSIHIYLPENRKSEVPSIFVRTPYGKELVAQFYLKFVERGYGLVVQDVRGTNKSEGKWIPNLNEMEDGDDTLNWIANQEWCDGNIGTIGSSYGGFVQWAAAASGNQHLKTIISNNTQGSPFFDVPRKGGAIISGILAWNFIMAGKKFDLKAAMRDDWDEILDIRPIKDIPFEVLGSEIEFWNEQMKHVNYDEYWKKCSWSENSNNIKIPALLVSGWYDDNGMGTTQAWETGKENNNTQKMILGPWQHAFNSTRDIHNFPFGNNAIKYDLDLLYLRWFDRFLKDKSNNIENEKKVEYYMVQENRWKQADNWPPSDTKYINFYLDSDGDAGSSIDNGKITRTVAENESPDQYIFNPRDPTPFLVDMSENEFSVPENYREVELRDDVLVYTSEPLKEDLAIAGELTAVIFAASSAKDTDWVVRLTDVDEDGNSIRISDGIIRARYRNSYARPELLEPGKVEKYKIRMSKIANLFKQGHRIRVEITSGAKNFAFPNHNTGKNPVTDEEYVIAKQKIYHSRKYPSHIKLPVKI